MFRLKLAIINLIPGTFLVPNLTYDVYKSAPKFVTCVIANSFFF